MYKCLEFDGSRTQTECRRPNKCVLSSFFLNIGSIWFHFIYRLSFISGVFLRRLNSQGFSLNRLGLIFRLRFNRFEGPSSPLGLNVRILNLTAKFTRIWEFEGLIKTSPVKHSLFTLHKKRCAH